MKRIIFILFLLFPTLRIFCQRETQTFSEIKGNLQLNNGELVKDELVLLYLRRDSSLVKTEFSDNKGFFSFKQLKSDTYFLCVKNPNFENFCSVDLFLETNLDLGTIQLKAITNELKEVVVVAQKPFIERSAGKTVINVDQSIQSAGSSAFEVIEKSPGVAVSLTDQISLNGKQGILVQINGKSLQMSGTDLANFLRGVPSSSIEKIEFLTNPSSKYDAAGSVIINIRMKKDTRFGTNGSFSTSCGHGVYPKANFGLNLNHRTKKWNFFTNYSFAYRKAFNYLDLNRRFYQQDTLQLVYEQQNLLILPFKNHIFRAGFDYQIDAKSTLSLSLNGISNTFRTTGNIETLVRDNNEQHVYSFETENRSFDNWYSAGLNLNYSRNTDSLGSTLSVDLDYALYGNETKQNFTTNYYDLDGLLLQNPYLLYGDLAGNLSIYSLKCDRLKTFENGSILEYGLKSSYVEADNKLSFFDKSNGGNIYDSLKSNHFIYTENINAAYVNYNLQHKKWIYKLGIRFENTNIKGNQLVYNQKFNTSYAQFFPSLSLRYKHNEKHSFDININRRIDRPSYDQLNPFKLYLDPTTYRVGNPYLGPQMTFGFDIGYVFKDRFYAIVGMARTFNNITETIGPYGEEENITVQTNVNLNHVDLIYTNISLPFELKKWWNLRIDLNGYLALYSGNAGNTTLSNRGSYNGNINMVSNFVLPKNQFLEVNSNYRTREVYAFDSIRRIWAVGFGYRIKILNSKGDLKFNITDAFYSSNILANVTFTDYKEQFLVKRETRVATVAFTYRFGSAQNNLRRRQGGADDLKQRVGGQMGGA